MTRRQRVVRVILEVIMGLFFYRRGVVEGRRQGEGLGRLRGALDLLKAQDQARTRMIPPRPPRFRWRSR